MDPPRNPRNIGTWDDDYARCNSYWNHKNQRKDSRTFSEHKQGNLDSLDVSDIRVCNSVVRQTFR